MWGHLSSLGQNVAQITKAVGAQLLDAAADDERLDAADFSDGDSAECSINEPGAVLVKKVQRLQDKLARARDEIDRLNDIRARATESVTMTIKNKDEEINELRQLLEETRTIVSESLSPRSASPEPPSNSEGGADAHIATPVIHQKIKASERVSMLTRKLHDEKRSHIAALHQIKNENAKFKDRLHSLDSQLAVRDSRIAELENQVSKQSEDLQSHKMVISRLRSEKRNASNRDEVEHMRKTIADQASTILELQSTCRDELEPKIFELCSELERLRSEQGLNEILEEKERLRSLLETERASLKVALKDLDALRLSTQDGEATRKLNHQIVQLTANLEKAQFTISELQTAKSEPASDSDLIPRQELVELRQKARAQLRQFAQKCKSLEAEIVELRVQQQRPLTDEAETGSSVVVQLEQRVSVFEGFVAHLREVLDIEETEPSLDALQAAIATRIHAASVAASPLRIEHESQLLKDLKEVLELDDCSPVQVMSEIRICLDRTQTAMAQNAAMTQAYEQAQESIDSLTATKVAMKSEIDALLHRISELQADCRTAFSEERALQEQNSKLSKQIETLQNKISETVLQQGQDHSSSISRINSLEQEVQYLEKEIGNKNAVIRELNSQLEHRTKRLLEVESIQDTWLDQAQRDRDTLLADSTRLRHDLETVSAEYESRIVALQDQIRKERDATYQFQLDLQASKDLAADYAALQVQLSAKSDECKNLNDDLDNLQVVLDQFQSESDSKLAEAEMRLQASLDAAEEGRLSVQELIQVTRSLKESESIIVQLEAKLSSSRKYALQIESDNAALRHAMQQTMDRIKTFSSDENLVDRRIVNKLLVTYLERKASTEVLNLMIRMLNFSEEQKRLVLEFQRPKGIMSSLSSFIPTPYSADDDDPEDGSPEPRSEQQNLADLWVNFLLKETGSHSRRNSTTSLHSPQLALSGRSPSSSSKATVRSPSNSIPDVPTVPRTTPISGEQLHRSNRSRPQSSLTPPSS